MPTMNKVVHANNTKQKASDDASLSAYQALRDMLDRPVQDNAGLKDLFSRIAPWDRLSTASTPKEIASIKDAASVLADRDGIADPAAYVRKLRAPRL
jgi:hypothetical protein